MIRIGPLGVWVMVLNPDSIVELIMAALLFHEESPANFDIKELTSRLLTSFRSMLYLL